MFVRLLTSFFVFARVFSNKSAPVVWAHVSSYSEYSHVSLRTHTFPRFSARFFIPLKDTQLLPFFTILANVCGKETRTCLFCECMGDDALRESSAGMECSEVHFHCGPCVAKRTMDLLKVENKGKCERLHGHIMCFKHPAECKATGFSERDLDRHLPLNVFQEYLSARMKIAEENMKAELEEKNKELLRNELEKFAAIRDERKRKVLMARKHIEEEILQMKCPRCRRAFYDFEGCFDISAVRVLANSVAGVSKTMATATLILTSVNVNLCDKE